ncbi:MAG: hypothetical protein ACPHVX_07150 [Flavobacteriaceae bacterium]
MGELNVTTSLEFESKILSYPDFVREKMKFLRELVIEVAKEIPEITDLEETLKWGEPSFLNKKRKYFTDRLEEKNSKSISDVFQVYQ